MFSVAFDFGNFSNVVRIEIFIVLGIAGNFENLAGVDGVGVGDFVVVG